MDDKELNRIINEEYTDQEAYLYNSTHGIVIDDDEDYDLGI